MDWLCLCKLFQTQRPPKKIVPILRNSSKN